MNDAMAKVLAIPDGMPIHRVRPRPAVEIPPDLTELPFIDKDSPSKEKIQQIWVAKVRVFDLTKEPDLKDYEKVWQQITDGLCRMCEHRIDFFEGRYLVLLRWAEFVYKLSATKR